MDHTIYLSLGTNLGNRLANLETAIQYLESRFNSLKRSSIYETPPWGFKEQPPFRNMVVVVQSNYSPRKVLKIIKSIEKKMGRKTSFRYGPRLIDIDILLYDQIIFKSEWLIIPHPRIADRAFVLVPLAEIAPDLVHPELEENIQELLKYFDTGCIKRYEPSILDLEQSENSE